MTLRGKVALITGAARGIGAETARQLVARGMKVSLIGMEPERLEALSTELGTGHHWAACDVTNQQELAAAVQGTVHALGGIDVVVANAGIANRGTVRISPVEAMIRVIDVNLSGVMRTVHTTLPHVVERHGYFLLVSSAAAFTAMPGMAAYAASKAGVEQFGNVLRLELAHEGVAVGLAHMTWIDTDMVRDIRHDSASFDAVLKQLPGVFGQLTATERCAAAFASAIENRSRKVFVPKGLSRVSTMRQWINSGFVERQTLRRAAVMVRKSEAEALANGQPFGANSVGMGKTE